MDLGSVIIDCETKHYNIGREAEMEWETRVANWNPRLRSIVTDHYLLDTSTGYSVKPVARAIKIKHAGFKLVSC